VRLDLAEGGPESGVSATVFDRLWAIGYSRSGDTDGRRRPASTSLETGYHVLRDETDEALMARYQKGDVRAFEVLLGRHRKPIYNFILRYTRDATLAEDLLQDCFLRLIKGLDGYQKQAKFTTWLYTIARNLCVDASRRGKHRKAYSLDAPVDKAEESGETRLDMTADQGLATDRKVIGKELHGKMEAAVQALSEEQREVFLMREILDMPFKEIAEVVGCPENTVKSRMRYALEKLREELEEYADMAKALP
jgi:RNA polymerase sigma-70 factor (ECF subfamily)